jgi:hypothetical protein
MNEHASSVVTLTAVQWQDFDWRGAVSCGNILPHDFPVESFNAFSSFSSLVFACPV